MREVKAKSRYKMVRLTEWAYGRLVRLTEHVRQEIVSNPERYPAHAGRRLTLSDVLVLLLERWES